MQNAAGYPVASADCPGGQPQSCCGEQPQSCCGGQPQSCCGGQLWRGSPGGGVSARQPQRATSVGSLGGQLQRAASAGSFSGQPWRTALVDRRPRATQTPSILMAGRRVALGTLRRCRRCRPAGASAHVGDLPGRAYAGPVRRRAGRLARHRERRSYDPE